MLTRFWTTARMIGRLTRSSFGLTLLLSGMAGVALARVDPPPAPEIDAGTAASALALLAGGIMLIKDRFRAK